MTDSNKKRSGSFRKFFPNLFFNKSKDKCKETGLKVTGKPAKSNQYHDPRSVIRSDKYELEDSETIYENLTTNRQSDNESQRIDVQSTSNHSSSSTLVSDSVKTRSQNSEVTSDRDHPRYAARPQVPPKPHSELHRSIRNHPNYDMSHYPDVYYHSVEKLTHKISPLDEIEIYRASQSQVNPASVGAEIKRVSTKFLISPKKEAEVRTIQPTRARSLSFDHNKENATKIENNPNVNKSAPRRAYNYSAPTSPMPISHKIPSMPKTASPYEHVRKTMIEAEEKRNNSLSRTSLRITSTPSPGPDYGQRSNPVTSTATMPQDNISTLDKEKTRQKVEAFYWHKLKEMKDKEDEYYLRQSLNSSLRSPVRQNAYPLSNCSTPTQMLVEPRSCSLPRGRDLQNYTNQLVYSSPFIRGAPERRTDTYITNRAPLTDPEIIYRHPEKLNPNMSPRLMQSQTPIFQRGSLTREITYGTQPKRVSFEEQYPKSDVKGAAVPKVTSDVYKAVNRENECTSKGRVVEVFRGPPLPPVRTTSVGAKTSKVVDNRRIIHLIGAGNSVCSESESGSEAGEIQRILQNNAREEDWHGDGSRIDGGLSDNEGRGPSRNRSSRRDDPRRHTLAGANHLYVHPHHVQHNTHDLECAAVKRTMNTNPPEYATVTKPKEMRYHRILDPRMKKPPLPRGYAPHSNALLFDDDPGIMSEVETASTGFRRGGKQRSSLPVVRTPSKTLERPLGLVFLQYRNETKRALLPNEITSIDTVKALFVRSFPKQLTMQYMDSQMVKIYIHDSSKDMFYELEDDRSGCWVNEKYMMTHDIPPLPYYVYPQTLDSLKELDKLKELKRKKRMVSCRLFCNPIELLREISDRSILRLFESPEGAAFPTTVRGVAVPVTKPAVPCSGPSSWEQDTYFSEPEIDSDYHHSHHVHKSKVVKAPAYYIGNVAPSTLPRGGPMLRAFSPAAPPVPADRVKTSNLPAAGHASEGYMSSPERGAIRPPYEDPYYTQFLGPAAGRANITPVIDEEAGDAVIMEDAYQIYGTMAGPCPMPRPPFDGRIPIQIDDSRLRVEKMERQLASLTGLVQKALQTPSGPTPPVAPRQDIPNCTSRAAQDPVRFASNERPPKLGRDKFQKSVSFEKSVSFSDDPPDMNSPKQHSPQHAAESKPVKPAIKSSTLPRTSSQERDRLKPAPPPKPAGLAAQQVVLLPPKTTTITVSPDFVGKLQYVQKQTRDVRIETRNLRRSALSHAIQMRQMVADATVKLGDLQSLYADQHPDAQILREEENYRQEMLMLENDLYELEASVERLRGLAANRYKETRVNMGDIERIALVLSKSSKTVSDWKVKFPTLQETMKARLATEMEKVVRKEKMLEDEPERLELALRRCKKLTGTLVTLKRLACVQEQRLPMSDGRISPTSSQGSSCIVVTSEDYNSDAEGACSVTHNKGVGAVCGRAVRGAEARAENALDALLDELQTFAKPSERERNGRSEGLNSCERNGRGEGSCERNGRGEGSCERNGRGDGSCERNGRGEGSCERNGRGEGSLRRLHSYPSGSDTDASPPVRARGQHPPKPPVPERHPELLAMAARRAPPPPPPRTTSRSPLASPTSPASPPNNDEQAASRQALLEHRHQELLKKQKALQEQYARLQMIQRSGTVLPPTAQPDLKKTGSESNLLTKMNLNLAPASISGSMTHLAADAERKLGMDTIKQNGTKPEGGATTNKVYETDIL